MKTATDMNVKKKNTICLQKVINKFKKYPTYNILFNFYLNGVSKEDKNKEFDSVSNFKTFFLKLANQAGYPEKKASDAFEYVWQRYVNEHKQRVKKKANKK